MSTAPLTPGSTPAESARTSHLQDVLTDCVDLGHRLTRKIVEKAEADTLPPEKAASAYDRVTRSMRRSAWLVGHLGRPAKTIDRTAIRKQIIRTVEDTIQRETDHPDHVETLTEELMDRLDTPDFDDELADRPIADIIADIVHDLGLGARLGYHPWKRRTPQDLVELQARARQPTETAAPPIRQPQAIGSHRTWRPP